MSGQMILLCGIPSEPPLELAIKAAEAKDVPFAIFNQRESHHINMCLHVDRNQWHGVLTLPNVEIALDGIAGVFARLMDSRDLPENKTSQRCAYSPEAFERSQVLQIAFNDWLDITRTRVLNRPTAMASNMSKPYQAQFITGAGFLTPRTLITNDPKAVREFKRENGRVIFKSISSIRSIVREFEGSCAMHTDRIRYLPTQFQEFIPGTNIRVHVVGNQIFATRVNSEAVDYRYAGRDGLDVDMEPCQLPEREQGRCLSLSRMLGLPLCGIDLKLTPAGEYYCFEVNPSPAYSYYQEHSGQPIAAAIIDYLVGA